MEENLLKLDELGHDDPTMLKMLEDMTGVNVRGIPVDDRNDNGASLRRPNRSASATTTR